MAGLRLIKAVELARVVETHWSWTGTGFRVFCIELRCPTEYVHAAVLGNTNVQAVVVKDYIDRRLLDAWADSMAVMAANVRVPERDVGVEGSLSPWTPRWF